VRTIVIATAFLYLWGWLVPRWLIGAERWNHPASTGALRVAALATIGVGLSVALWCALEFAVRGRGTPAPFDPPRRLVVRGLYRYVRNPMYLGALTALLGEALFLTSWELAALAAVLFGSVNIFIVFFEEPGLAKRFGAEYEAYRTQVNRWLPNA
jgi:protein-S-isoprenylcysteine O-methyltransferase Ste14